MSTAIEANGGTGVDLVLALEGGGKNFRQVVGTLERVPEPFSEVSPHDWYFTHTHVQTNIHTDTYTNQHTHTKQTHKIQTKATCFLSIFLSSSVFCSD